MTPRNSLLSVVVVLLVGAGACGSEDAEQPNLSPSERAWSAAESIEDATIGYWAKVTSDPQGNAMLVWDDLEGEVRAKHYDGASGAWSTSAVLDADNPIDSANPNVSLDGSGNAVAVWQRQDEALDNRSVWVNRYDAVNRVWGAAEQIAGSELALVPQVDVDRAGNAVVVFSVADIGAAIATARFDAEAGTWSAAEPLVTGDGVGALGSLAAWIALEPGGDGVTAWTARDFETSAVWVARYSKASGTWSGAQAVSPSVEMAQATDVAINEAGTAVAVWVQSMGGAISVWASRSEATGAGWSPAERVGVDEGALFPRVVIDSSGNATVAWSSDDGTRTTIWANRYTAAAGAWGTAERLEPDDVEAVSPTLGIDGDGNVLALWTRWGESRRGIPTARWYAAAEGAWLPSVTPESNPGSDSELGEVAVAADGRAVAIWYRDGASIVASHFR